MPHQAIGPFRAAAGLGRRRIMKSMRFYRLVAPEPVHGLDRVPRSARAATSRHPHGMYAVVKPNQFGNPTVVGTRSLCELPHPPRQHRRGIVRPSAIAILKIAAPKRGRGEARP